MRPLAHHELLKTTCSILTWMQSDFTWTPFKCMVQMILTFTASPGNVWKSYRFQRTCVKRALV